MERKSLSTHREQVLHREQHRVGRLDAGADMARYLADDLGFLFSVVLANADRLEPALPETHRHLVTELRAACQSGAATIRDLLAFSGNDTITVAPLDIRLVVQDAAPSLRAMLGRGVNLLTFVGSPTGAIQGDAAAIKRIMKNVVMNAREAMPGGGTLHIEVSDAWLGNERQDTHPWLVPGRYVCLSIGDSGRGMKPETLARACEPFFTTKPRGKGAGLGLSVAYGLVRQHKGAIDISSEVGLGTTVKAYFPVESVRE